MQDNNKRRIGMVEATMISSVGIGTFLITLIMNPWGMSQIFLFNLSILTGLTFSVLSLILIIVANFSHDGEHP